MWQSGWDGRGAGKKRVTDRGDRQKCDDEWMRVELARGGGMDRIGPPNSERAPAKGIFESMHCNVHKPAEGPAKPRGDAHSQPPIPRPKGILTHRPPTRRLREKGRA